MVSLWLKALILVFAISYIYSSRFISNKIENYQIETTSQESNGNSNSNSDNGGKPSMSPCTTEQTNQQKQPCLLDCFQRYPPEAMGDFCYVFCSWNASGTGPY